MSQNYNLNQGQQAASDNFFEFLLSDEKEMIISGPGGCGKTHLMGHMIDEVMPKYHQVCNVMGIDAEYIQVNMTATTNQAAEELGKATNRQCGTIHSFMNLRLQDDYSTGKSQIKKTRSWTVHKNAIIFVDEAPMIDTPLRSYILEGTNKCKIVYVGDDCQLAPVKEPISPIYGLGLREVQLTEQMRTNVPELQALNDLMRSRVPNKEFGAIPLVPGLIDWLDGPQMEQAIHDEFINQNTGSRILAYTNERVLDFNEHIRQLRGLPQLLTAGEHLVCNSAFCPTDSRGNSLTSLSVQAKVTILNASPVFEVAKLGNAEMHVQRVDLVDQFGNILNDVAVPCDSNHYGRLLKHFGGEANWPMYFKLKNEYPDLRAADASTVYKAQGSTYDTSFIDVGNIGECNRPDVVARMLYVAVSRARKRVVFYGDLPSKYGHFVRT